MMRTFEIIIHAFEEIIFREGSYPSRGLKIRDR
jgi:hypothetical protein